MRNNKNKGFTLVELLVVIAILAILATVSVVGYTSFIKSAHISNDENIAAQLNQFLAAYQADHTTEHYGKPITEDNIREITQAILKDSGLDDLDPHADGYHFYFHFDGNGSGEYIAMSDKDMIHTAGYKVLTNSLNVSALNVNSNYLGSCFTTDSTYFFVDTKGSPLAEVVETLYSFNEDVDYTALMEKVNGLTDSEGAKIQKLIDYVNAAVIVTDEANYRLGTTQEAVIFADGVKALTDTTKKWESNRWSPVTVDDSYILATITGELNIPASLEFMAKDSLNLGSAATVVINKPAAQVAKMAYENFANANVTLKLTDGEFTTADKGVNTDKPVITNGTVEYPLEYSNPMISFTASVTGETNKTAKIDSFSAYVVWDAGKFYLAANNFVGKDSTVPATGTEVKWEIANEYKSFVSINPELDDNGKSTGRYVIEFLPITNLDAFNALGEFGGEIKIVGTPASAEAQAETFTVQTVYYKSVSYELDNYDVDTNEEITLLYGKDVVTKDDVVTEILINKYSLEQIGVELNLDSVPAGLSISATPTINDGAFVLDGTELTLKDVTDHGTKTLVINTGNFDYLVKTVTIDLYNTDSLVFTEANSNILYVGDENNIFASDLFNLNLTEADIPEDAQLWIIKNLGGNKFSDMNSTAAATDYATVTKIDLNASWKKTEIDFKGGDEDFATDFYNEDGSFNTGYKDVFDSEVVAVIVAPDHTGNYVRISANHNLIVVKGNNVRDYNGITHNEVDGQYKIKTGTNNILLADISIPENGTYGLDGYTFFGNCFTFDITKGKTSGVWGIISLKNGNMLDTRVIGKFYEDLGLGAMDPYGSNAVHAYGKSAIVNCYIANTRAPLAAGSEEYKTFEHNITVMNTVLYGGKYANLELRSGNVTFEGQVITINQPHTEEHDSTKEASVGLGLIVWLEAKDGSGFTNIENVTQHNFIPDTFDDLPVITLKKPITVDIKIYTIDITLVVDIDTEIAFDGIFDNTTTYGQYIYTDGTTKYVNAGVIGEDIGESLSSLISMPTGDRTGLDTISMPVNLTLRAEDVASWATSLVNGFLRGIKPDVYMHVYAIQDDKATTDVNELKPFYEASKNAEYKYSPWDYDTYKAWTFDANGNIIH